ncbi:phospholipid phosphatase 5 isoform X2 [Arctopsyche grandis]
MSPFDRYIQPDEMWLYRNPRRDPYVSNATLWCLVLLTPLTLALVHLVIKRDKEDFVQIMLAVTLALGINCLLTNIVKLIIGRPRPDFFWRCFPDGEMNSEMQCTGPLADVIEGRKSFPSGHSSISFTSLGTMSWWMMGKFHVWSSCRGSSLRLLLTLTPLVIAGVVAMSRTCDYHHHWQDVTVGSLLGLMISYMCYRQYFPSLTSQYSHKPYSSHFQSVSTIQRRESSYLNTPGPCIACKMSSSSEQLTDALADDIDYNSDIKLDGVLRNPNLLPIKPPVKWI